MTLGFAIGWLVLRVRQDQADIASFPVSNRAEIDGEQARAGHNGFP